MKEYVAGFLFDNDAQRVVLVLKKRGPSNVVDHWNAVGGKVEPGESPKAAMIREFEEETGVAHDYWTHFCTLFGEDWRVYFFYDFDTTAQKDVDTTTDEVIMTWYLDELPEVVGNLRWLLPMAVHFCDMSIVPYEVQEKEAA
jgi:8-oxo-dGTP pyrophosphatase MutT (NUDIX family)